MKILELGNLSFDISYLRFVIIVFDRYTYFPNFGVSLTPALIKKLRKTFLSQKKSIIFVRPHEIVHMTAELGTLSITMKK